MSIENGLNNVSQKKELDEELDKETLKFLDNLGKPFDEQDIPTNPDSKRAWDEWQNRIKGKTPEEIEIIKAELRQQIEDGILIK